MTDLENLLTRVEGATGPNYDLEERIAQLLEPERLTHFRTPPNYTASLDAALALVGRVLPGAFPGFQKNAHVSDERRWSAWVDVPTEGAKHGYDQHEGVAPTPALAILSAMLRALADAERSEVTATGGHASPGKDHEND